MTDTKTGKIIYFGNYKKAVICQVYDQENVEVVYLDDRNRAINEDMILTEGNWTFKVEGSNGGYADKYSRLSEYVRILRQK